MFFKFTPVFFLWMFLRPIKEINWLISKGISNIYLNNREVNQFGTFYKKKINFFIFSQNRDSGIPHKKINLFFIFSQNRNLVYFIKLFSYSFRAKILVNFIKKSILFIFTKNSNFKKNSSIYLKYFYIYQNRNF